MGYRVVIHDDEEHTAIYVVDLFKSLYGKSHEDAVALMRSIDRNGTHAIEMESLDLAMAERDRIFNVGPDALLERSRSSLTVSIEEIAGANFQTIFCGRMTRQGVTAINIDRLREYHAARLKKYEAAEAKERRIGMALRIGVLVILGLLIQIIAAAFFMRK